MEKNCVDENKRMFYRRYFQWKPPVDACLFFQKVPFRSPCFTCTDWCVRSFTLICCLSPSLSPPLSLSLPAYARNKSSWIVKSSLSGAHFLQTFYISETISFSVSSSLCLQFSSFRYPPPSLPLFLSLSVSLYLFLSVHNSFTDVLSGSTHQVSAEKIPPEKNTQKKGDRNGNRNGQTFDLKCAA